MPGPDDRGRPADKGQPFGQAKLITVLRGGVQVNKAGVPVQPGVVENDWTQADWKARDKSAGFTRPEDEADEDAGIP